MPVWASALLLLLAAAFVALENFVSTPSCRISGRSGDEPGRPDHLKVMMVADLLLLGPDAKYVDLFFRDPFTSKFFSKSFQALRPDMLIVLGDISAKGWNLTESQWIALLQQFQKMLGLSVDFPLHIVLGDRDIGECSKLDGKFVRRLASHLPGLGSSGCGAFEIANVSFISLNAIAMVCNGNELRFNVEKAVERESADLEENMKNRAGEVTARNEEGDIFSDFRWKDNGIASGSGPVVLLHLPLHRSTDEASKVIKGNCGHDSSVGPTSEYSRIIGIGEYDMEYTLPANATEYILQALKPRIVFSGHTHSFSDCIRVDGTREVTVPAMTWATRGKPGFVVANFGREDAISVSHCSFPEEQYVIFGYVLLFLVSVATVLFPQWTKYSS